MKLTTLTLSAAVLAASSTSAFMHNNNGPMKPFLAKSVRSFELFSSGGFLGDEVVNIDNDVTQNLSEKERKDNLEQVRALYKVEIEDAQRYNNYQGFVDGRKKLKQRRAADVWFVINESLRKAVLVDDVSEIDRLTKLIDQVGGPPPGVVITESSRKYATFDEIYDLGMSAERTELLIRRERAKKNHQLWEQMNAKREEAEKNQPWGDPYESPEMQKKKERTMRFVYQKLEERRKKEQERAKKLAEEVKAAQVNSPTASNKEKSALDIALEAAQKAAAESKRKKELGQKADADDKSEGAKDKNRATGDEDVLSGIIKDPVLSSSSCSTNGLNVKVSSSYNSSQSDPTMRKHVFTYKIEITNESNDTIKLVSRKFEIQTVGSKSKDIVQGQGVTGKQPVLKPGEVFTYSSTAPLSVRPISTTPVAARMSGEYSFVVVKDGDEESETKSATLEKFHFIFPEDQRVKPVEESQDDEDETTSSAATATASAPKDEVKEDKAASPAANTMPGDEDITKGVIEESKINQTSTTISDGVKVEVAGEYRSERSNPTQDKYCFAYNVRITNESEKIVQLVSRRFEIQRVGADVKDVVQGPGVTGKQPILKPGESFEYTSTAPLSLKRVATTSVAARMSGEYSFLQLQDDESTPLSSTPLQAKMSSFHFVLPDNFDSA